MFGHDQKPSLGVTRAFHSVVLWGGRALESKGVEELHATCCLIWDVNSWFKQESRSISGCLPSRFTAGTSALGTLGS